jgi:phage terminase large subunit-like protein
MDLERAAHALDWMGSRCVLYEGDQAGRLIKFMPFQVEFITRLFGWVWWSEDWGGWVRRFRSFALWCAKKNGKSPTQAALGLYMLIGDGEPGQKVYNGAKNGQQARITQKHAYLMARNSPGIADECRFNRATLEITHEPSESQMIILTGDDERGQAAKEGLNGSVMVDEAHVFDWKMAERVDRAGISRREPLFGTVSTAGDDPASWGYHRFRYGRQILRGERLDDLTYLHVEYCAPDGTSERDVAADPEGFGKMANPAWGRIVKPTEFLNDFKTSRGDVRKMMKCLQYRFNLWIGSASRWLPVDGWAAGEQAYTPEELRGRECFVGVDLARRLDMAAVVFVFPWPEEHDEAFRVWPLFWMPRQTAEDQNKLFPFLTWGGEGRAELKLIDGPVLDFNVLKHDCREIVREYEFAPRGLYYDPKYAEEVTQALVDGEWGRTEQGEEWEVAGWGCERYEVDQSTTALAAPSAELERRVKMGACLHPGNGVLNWQAGHAEVKRLPSGDVRPVKPTPDSGKKIDGILALTLTMYGLANLDNTPRVWG